MWLPTIPFVGNPFPNTSEGTSEIMSANWYLYHFDYDRYGELCLALGCIKILEDLEPLIQDPESQTIYDELLEDSISLEVALHALVETQCCIEEPLVFANEMPLLAAHLGKRREGQEAATILSELLSEIGRAHV